ncbi:hypothetical protein B9Z55_025987 [Caenorhabditis nigoni]|nr:hypothetical protein B9Z55_025987 [Caenorhabditis nigoni]
MKWAAEKEGYEQMAKTFLDAVNEQTDLIKSLEKERDTIRMEKDAEKEANEELTSKLNVTDRKLEAFKEKKQTKENVWKAKKEALEAQVREDQAYMERIQDLAQQFPRIQGLPRAKPMQVTKGSAQEEETNFF